VAANDREGGRNSQPLVVIPIVRARQIADQLRHRLSFVPTLHVLAAIVLVHALLWLDRSLVDDQLPIVLETTVESARSVFSAIAGGLITSITLLLSMMLVAVQLASSQFSPRTLRDWLANRTLQHTVGFVLGTTVFCLLALRSTRSFDEVDSPLVPHITVIVAVLLGVLSLVGVVRAVDRITHSLRVGTVADRVAGETIAVIGRVFGATRSPEVVVGPDSGALQADGTLGIPIGAAAVEAPVAGWVQQVDEQRLLEALPADSTGYLVTPTGSFVSAHSPVVWIAPAPRDVDSSRSTMLEAIAIGDTRTMQQDVEFGVIQLTDIAVRALSPGVNDPGTACDIIVHLGNVMNELWTYQPLETTRHSNSVTLVSDRPTHAHLLGRAFGPIIHYGGTDREVVLTLSRVVTLLRSEVQRRELPGPIEPLDELVNRLETTDVATVTAPDSGS
jgi:uncharacterized membrane protein